MIVVFGFLCIWNGMIQEDKKENETVCALVFREILIPLGIYLISNACTVEEHAGATNLTLTEALRQNRKFFPAFFISLLHPCF